MFFSVIITTYGERNNNLKNAIQSVIDQTFKNYEIIVVDDNGKNKNIKDKNQELIKNYPQVRYYTYPENRGANFARNYGVKKSNGEYITFLDDDDKFLSNKLEEIYKNIENRNFDLIYSGRYILKNNKKYYSYEETKEIKKDILKSNFIGSNSFVILKKRKLEEIGLFNENLKSCQDWDAWIRVIFSRGQILGIDLPLVEYCVNPIEKTRISNNFLSRIQGHEYILKETKEKYLNNFSYKDKIEILFFQQKRIANIYYEYFNFIEYRKIMNEIFNLKYFNIKDYIKYIFSYFNLKITKKRIEKIK